MRFPRVNIILLAVLCAVCATAQERRESVPWSVSAGFGGLVPTNDGLVPVVFRIENAVASTSGTLRLWQKASPLQRIPGTTHELPLDLPAPSTREYVVYARLDPQMPLTVSVTFESELADIAHDLTLRPLRKRCVLAVDVPESYLRQGVGRDYQFVATEREDLIADPLAYDAVFAVMLRDTALKFLTKKQTAALARWVVTGGRLILVGRYGSYTSHANFREINAVADMRTGGTGVHACGAGIVAIDDRDEFVSQPMWRTNEEAGQKLFPPVEATGGSDAATGLVFTSEAGVLSELTASLDVKRKQKAGAAVALLVIVFGYLACIGPGDFLLTRRLRKPRLTWVLFPGGIVAFSVLAAVYGRSVHHHRRRALALTILDVPWQGSVARGNTMAWLYSPRHQEHALGVTEPAAIASVRDVASGAGRAVAATVRHGGEPGVAARIPAYSSRVFDVAWYMEWEHRFRFHQRPWGVELVCPPDLPVSAVHIASESGILACEYSPVQKRWSRPHALTVPWERWAGGPSAAVSRFGATFTKVWDQPSTDPLAAANTAHYATLISCIHEFSTKEEEDDGERWFYTTDEYWGKRWPVVYTEKRWGTAEAASIRNRRERALNISDRFSGKRRVALLVLRPDADSAPIRLGDEGVETTQMTIVRLQLPEQIDGDDDVLEWSWEEAREAVRQGRPDGESRGPAHGVKDEDE